MENLQKKADSTVIDIFDVMLALVKHKWFIIIFTVTFSIGAVVYSLLKHNIWNSSGTFLTITDGMSSSSIGSSLLGNMGLDFMGGIASEEALSNLLILDSRDLKKKVIRKFDLIRYYEITEEDTLKAMEMALRLYDEKTCGVYFDKESNAITVSAKTEDKVFSQTIVNFILDELQKYNQNDRTTKGKQKREFLQERVRELDLEFAKLTNQMLELKKETRLISVVDQTSQILSLYSELITERTKTEIEKSVIEKSYSQDNPEFKKKQLLVDELSKEIQNLERNESISKYIVPIDNIPDAALRNQILEMQIEINRKIYEFVYPQFELAKMEEVKDLPTIDIISRPDLEGEKVRPKRAIICIVVFMVSFISSSIMALILEFTSEESKQKAVLAWKIFIGKK
jgi:uncharacterized protein involved in exopolysaccharide biosynthesis